jgi:hypothetical protein
MRIILFLIGQCFSEYGIKIQKNPFKFDSIKKNNKHEKNLFLLVFIACSMTMMGQTDKRKATKKVGISSLEDLILHKQRRLSFLQLVDNNQIEIFM